MDVSDLERFEEWLEAYLSQFADCFGRSDTRSHLTTYVRGQLSDLDAKSVEPIALQAGTPVRTLQEFLVQHRWNEDALRQRMMHIVRDEHITANSVGVIDETSDVKKGDKTPGVQGQWCGKVGKQENCIVTVHLSAATEGFTACSMVNCFFRRVGAMIGRVVPLRESLTKWSIDPSGRSRWNCLIAVSPKALCSLG